MPMLFPKASAESPPMFESGFADRFSRTHYMTVPLLFVPATCWLLYCSSLERTALSATLGLMVAGWLVWTLTEYLLHRFFFHWRPEGKLGEQMHFIFHGVHHQWPKDPYRLVMPPIISVTLFWVFLALWQLVLGGAAWAFHAGFVLGYLWYDLGHYMMHHGRARFAWFKKLQQHHLVHHAPGAADDAKFGVSSTLWDHVFRTYAFRRAEDSNSP